MSEEEKKKNDHLLATLFVMLGMIELFQRFIEKNFNKCGVTMKGMKYYRYMKRIFEKLNACKDYYDKITDVSISVCKCDDKCEASNAYMNDYNLYLRLLMMVINSIHGDNGSKCLQLESTLKVMTKNPIFDQDDIDKLTNFH